MSAGEWDALLAASQRDWKLKQALSGAQSVEELVAVANQQGFDLVTHDVPVVESDSGELSEAELEGVTGGTLGLGITNFPECMPTGWVQCGHPH